MICKIIVFGLGTSCYCYPFVNGLIPHRRQGEGWGLTWPGATNSIWPSNYNANRIKRADQSFIISFILLRLWKNIEKIFFKYFLGGVSAFDCDLWQLFFSVCSSGDSNHWPPQINPREHKSISLAFLMFFCLCPTNGSVTVVLHQSVRAQSLTSVVKYVTCSSSSSNYDPHFIRVE